MKQNRTSWTILLVSASVVAMVIIQAGCATIFNSTSQDVRFDSEPSGAEVMVGGVERGTTPTTVNLKKPGISEQRITIVKEGYEDKTITLQKEFATASIFNLFGPTIVGFGIDAASGALFNYSPTQYTVDLDEAGSNEDSDSMKDNVDDRNVYQLRSLRQNAHGQYIIPGQLQDVSIINTSTGAVYTTK